MRVSQNKTLFFIAGLAVIAGIGIGIWLRSSTHSDFDKFEDLTLPAMDGRVRSIAEWKGKTILVNFWATWCGPCREEIPLLNDIQARYGSRGLQVVGIAIDEVAEIATYGKTMRIDYPILVADLDTLSLMARYGNASGALPYTLILDTNGRMIDRKLGAYRRAELEALIQKILPPAP